jgi:hypothetical protein
MHSDSAPNIDMPHFPGISASIPALQKHPQSKDIPEDEMTKAELVKILKEEAHLREFPPRQR